MKLLGFRSAFLLPARKLEVFTHGETQGTREIDHPTWRKTQAASIAKGWKDKRDPGRIPDKRVVWSDGVD